MPGEGPWDPIGFSKLHENIQGSEHAGVVPSQQWMREAEIKHGRVAMLAFTGALVQSYGMHFDGKMNGMFYEKGVNPFEATPSAFATNPMGMAQILLFIGLTEGYTFPEGAWSGDMKREPGDLGYRVMRSADVMEEQQIKEQGWSSWRATVARGLYCSCPSPCCSPPTFYSSAAQPLVDPRLRTPQASHTRALLWHHARAPN